MASLLKKPKTGHKLTEMLLSPTKTMLLASFALVVLSFLQLGMALKYCYQGTYEIERDDGYLMCDLCHDGTYMNKYDHRETACYKCSKPDPDKKEIEYTPCNRTHDTTFLCMEGYYRDLPRNPRETGRCVKCTDCEAQGLYPGRACQTFSDSICCANEMFDVAENGDGHPMCRERPRMCGPGQYYSHESNECIPCPSGTYMDLEYHSSTECWKCPSMADYYVPLHTVIDQECNGTHPATYRCADNYYRNHHMGHTDDDATGCAPCTNCTNLKDKPYKGLKCTPETDTVCCPQPNMEVKPTPEGVNVCCPDLNITVTTEGDTVCCPRPGMVAVDGDKGPECDNPITTVAPVELTCGVMEFLHIDVDNKKRTCKPCPEGTVMNETDHVYRSCHVIVIKEIIEYYETDQQEGHAVGDKGIIVVIVIATLLIISVALNIIMCIRMKNNLCHQCKKQMNPFLKTEA